MVSAFISLYSAFYMYTKYVVNEHQGTRLEGGHQLPRLLPACGALMKGSRGRVTMLHSRFRTNLAKWPSGYHSRGCGTHSTKITRSWYELWPLVRMQHICQYCLHWKYRVHQNLPMSRAQQIWACVTRNVCEDIESQVEGSLSIHRVIRQEEITARSPPFEWPVLHMCKFYPACLLVLFCLRGRSICKDRYCLLEQPKWVSFLC